jgi:hypothetical protein
MLALSLIYHDTFFVVLNETARSGIRTCLQRVGSPWCHTDDGYARKVKDN